jgi:tRNA pseudouridine38-40 synthase
VRTRIGLVIQYDGTDFCGWAEQASQRTVQGTLKTCIESLCGHEIELRGASRTDAGAHALGQRADFETDLPMPAEKWSLVLSDRLAPEIVVTESFALPPEFHSRFYARSRTYRYRLSEQRHVNPLVGRYVHPVGAKLDVEAMQAAASRLKGRHDFRAFSEQLKEDANTVRRVTSCRVGRVRDEVVVTIRANAFLRGMVRRIVGGLVEVGLRRRTVEGFASLLDPGRRDSLTWPVVLPANGLTLIQVDYGRRYRDLRLDKKGKRQK